MGMIVIQALADSWEIYHNSNLNQLALIASVINQFNDLNIPKKGIKRTSLGIKRELKGHP
jgi:hypothetical protein